MAKRNSTGNDPRTQRKKILRQLKRNQKLIEEEAHQPGYGTGEGEESYRNRERNLHAENAEWQRKLQRQQDAKDREERDEQEKLELLRRIVSGAGSRPVPATVQPSRPFKSPLNNAIWQALSENLDARAPGIADWIEEKATKVLPFPPKGYEAEIKANRSITTWPRLYRDCPRFRHNFDSAVSKMRARIRLVKHMPKNERPA